MHNNQHLPDPTSPFIRTHLFPNPAPAGRCTSGGRARRLCAALEAVLRFVEVALDLVGGDLAVDCLVAHDAGGDLLAVVRDEGDLPAARVLSAVDAGAARLAAQAAQLHGGDVVEAAAVGVVDEEAHDVLLDA